ncbi:GNAT family N-acetyltransferase [Streptomyces sp. NPDC001848]|uniref:GNAT family N-acetyltransferase n=1 Tax=Streptomyces sp. NPDC001848 TaxID=3364618 RepID=UPI003692D934
MLRGSPEKLTPDLLAPLAGNRVEAPARFLPALGAAFDRLTPWERMIWTLQAAPQPAGIPRAMTVRRLERTDADAVRVLGTDASWLSAGWGGPRGLAASGHAWAAVDRTARIQAVACTYFRGTHYGDVAVHTASGRTRHHLALARVNALGVDIGARGHLPSWNCSVHNRASRLLAWNAGFRLVRQYVHYAVGSRWGAGAASARKAPSPVGRSRSPGKGKPETLMCGQRSPHWS